MRIATAEAVLQASPETLRCIREGRVPKGDPLPVAKVAAVQAAKNASRIIPYCHPLPVDYVGVDFDLQADRIVVTTTIKVIYKTGVEMEALTAASVAVLTLYDMLKMLDQDMAITGVRLISKRGGKSDFGRSTGPSLRAAVIVASDSVSGGMREDRSGRYIVERLEELGIKVSDYRVISDDLVEIERVVRACADERQCDLVITTGGTGLSPRDNTPEAVSKLIEKKVPGIAEIMRAHGQERTPYAMLSRAVSGLRGKTLIITLPGSKEGVRESLDTLLPAVLHAVEIMHGGDHSARDQENTGAS